MENRPEESAYNTQDFSSEYEAGADLMRLLERAAAGEFNPDMLPAELAASRLAEVLTNLGDARKAVNMNPIPMLTLDADLNFIDANNSALELFGWSRKEALRQNVNAIDVQDLKGEHVAVTVREKRLTSCEVTLRCPKGILILKTWAAPLLDSAGNIRGAFMELIDITLEKEEAANVAAWYESVLNAVHLPIAVTDLDMKLTFVNSAAETLIGRKNADLFGRPCAEWNTEICGTRQCAITRLRQGETRTLFNMDDIRFQVDAFYAKDAAGKAIGHVEILEDITAQVRVSEYMDREVERLAGNLEKLARGDLAFDLAVAEGDKYTRDVRENFVRINDDLREAKKAIDLVIADTEKLTGGAAGGNLGFRADVSKHNGDYRAILEGANNLLDAVADPFEMALDNIDRIGRGEIPEKITADYQGDFNKIKVSLNQCIDGLAGLTEANRILQRFATNDYTARMDGKYRGVFAEVATAVNQLGSRIDYISEIVERISHGDLSDRGDLVKIGKRSEQDRLLPGFVRTLMTLEALADDMVQLTQAAQKGDLSARADASKHEGEYRHIVEGVNEALDAIVDPFEVASNYMDQIGRGEIPEKITTEYHGDFDKLKKSLNWCIEGLGGLTEANHALQRMAVNDHTVRVIGKYYGVFAEVAAAVNDVQDKINHVAEVIERISHGDLSDREAIEKIGSLSEQDRLAPSVLRTLTTLEALTTDMEHLAQTAQKGDLSVRADAARHEGEYQKIVAGVNGALDAIAVPFEVASNYMDQIGRGEIPEKITTEYHGDFDKLKKSLNWCIEGLGGLTEANHALQRMAVNDHTVRVTGKYYGVFAEVAAAVNDVQDRVNYIADTIDMISHGDLTRLDEYRKLGRRSEQDRVAPGFLRTLETLQALTDDMVQLTRAAQRGDLGRRIEVTKHEGEYSHIVAGVNATLDIIVDPFKKVQGAIVQLESSTQDTSKSSDEIAKAAEQVAMTSQRCADLSKQVLRQIEGVERQVADLSASNEEITGTAQEVLGATNETVRTGRESLKLGEATKDKMAVVEKISRQSMDEIARLNGQMAEIGEIVKLINDIANQTNLLALNAAIEAARAGEHGRGFAVVAGEIRNLAGESKNASHNIEELIASILANSNQTAKNMELVYAEIESGVENVNGTIAELGEIVSGAELIGSNMGEIARAIEEQANVANRVVQAMGEGTRLTQETQAQMENLASLSEEASASTEEIGSATHELNGMAQDLKEAMERFSF